MVKETGQEFLMGEEPVVAETAFTAEASSGTVALTYELDSTGLEGRTLVVFEELLYGNTVLTSHEDPEDEAQSVRYPKLRTEAAVQGEHETEAAGTVKITDRVFYENLIPGKTYTLKAALMNQETGRALTAGGMEITAVHLLQRQLLQERKRYVLNFLQTDWEVSAQWCLKNCITAMRWSEHIPISATSPRPLP